MAVIGDGLKFVSKILAFDGIGGGLNKLKLYNNSV